MSDGKIKEVKTMRTTYKNFKITSTFLGNKCWNADEKQQNYNNHIVTVINIDLHKKTAFEFWGSIMNPEISTDEDSRKAYKIFKACEKSLKKAERIGIDEDMACEIMNDLQENYEC